jgi:hypothetical protein
MIDRVARYMIAARVARLNNRLGRPKEYFVTSNGGRHKTAAGHITFHHDPIKGYQLAEVADDCGNERTDIFGLSGQYLKADCFYTVLNVILACARR